MSALSQCRVIAGGRAFGAVMPMQAKRICNGSKYFMRRKDSFMVEVDVGEEEPEDIAVRRYMKLVSESRILEQMRWRRYTETKIERAKRRLRERIERNKNNIVDATWEELYGQDTDPKPFEVFFSRDGDGNESFFLSPYPGQSDMFPGNYMDSMESNKWGSYNDTYRGAGGSGSMGGYMYSSLGGGYINQQQGGYINQLQPGSQGGYISPQQPAGGYSAPAEPADNQGPEELPPVEFKFE